MLPSFIIEVKHYETPPLVERDTWPVCSPLDRIPTVATSTFEEYDFPTGPVSHTPFFSPISLTGIEAIWLRMIQIKQQGLFPASGTGHFGDEKERGSQGLEK